MDYSISSLFILWCLFVYFQSILLYCISSADPHPPGCVWSVFIYTTPRKIFQKNNRAKISHYPLIILKKSSQAKTSLVKYLQICYYRDKEVIEMKRDYDKFQRWLERFNPGFLDKYKQGVGRGEVKIVGFEWGYHLYYEDKLLGTLMER